eukprot:TRINITY_DN23030_c0_g1_i1.p1 TRINITY_DN23030_c0_g1~~TRINITY_DN23030_c0_g1_i1.p1  ORF type:complete len:273 (-),score=56.85 TRINITY_DN23030_c0_g1_i1:647-1465(-)
MGCGQSSTVAAPSVDVKIKLERKDGQVVELEVVASKKRSDTKDFPEGILVEVICEEEQPEVSYSRPAGKRTRGRLLARNAGVKATDEAKFSSSLDLVTPHPPVLKMMRGTGAVQPGDVIVCVNGVFDDVRAMKRALRRSKINSLVIQRPVVAAPLVPAPRPAVAQGLGKPLSQVVPLDCVADLVANELRAIVTPKAGHPMAIDTPTSLKNMALGTSKAMKALAFDSPKSRGTAMGTPKSQVGSEEVLGAMCDVAVEFFACARPRPAALTTVQ